MACTSKYLKKFLSPAIKTFFLYTSLLNGNCLFCTIIIFCILVIFKPHYLTSEQLNGFIDEEIDFDSLYSDLPADLDISSASLSSLESLPFFSHESAQNVIALRDSLSPDYFLHNSDNITGLSTMEYAVLKQLAYSQKSRPLSGMTGSVRQGIIHKPTQEDLSESKYFLKFHSVLNDKLEINLITERDSSEPRAFDLFSGNAEIRLNRNRMRIVIGDYRPGFGQGLLFSRYGRNYGNGTGIMLKDTVNSANTSYQESYFMRGTYISMEKKWFAVYAWYSIRRLDATLDDTGDAVTIRDTGYHVSGSVRENLSEKISGARLGISPCKGLSLGATGAVSNYSPRLAKKDGEAYYNDTEGSILRHASFDGKFKKGPAVFFLEHARMGNNEHASLGGLNMVKNKFRSSLVFRHYSPGYHALRSGGFSSFGETSNEKGVYSAIRAELPYKTRFSASMDIARTLYRRASERMPSSRKRLYIVIESRARKNYTTWMSVRTTDDSGASSRRWNYRIALQKKLGGNASIRWRSMFAWSETVNNGGPYGESALLIHKKNFRCDFIGGVFNIPSYDARLYRYEYNVRGRGYSRAVWGEGGIIICIVGWGPFSTRYRYSNSDLMDSSQQITFQLDSTF